MQIKTCNKCNKTKDLLHFSKQKGCKDGYRPDCRVCKSNQQSKLYYSNPKKYLDKKRSYNKEYYENNKERVLARNSKYIINRTKNDPIFRFKAQVRSLINMTFKKKGTQKSTKTELILGCSLVDFMQHIESQFQPGMTWKNHGLHGWHIDHKVPINQAQNYDDVVKLNHCSNLQSLWAKDNLQKSDKVG